MSRKTAIENGSQALAVLQAMHPEAYKVVLQSLVALHDDAIEQMLTASGEELARRQGGVLAYRDVIKLLDDAFKTAKKIQEARKS